jgi:hypothetical protein
METQNVTLSIPKDVLRRAKHVAIDRGISLSRLLVESIAKAADDDRRYRVASRKLLRGMKKGFNLGVGDGPLPPRETLYERGARVR